MLRNREFKHFILWFALLAAVTVILGFNISPAAGILTVTAAAACGTLFVLFTRARYQSIARISSEIDLVLHNADHLYIGKADEGELSILHSEITKMTLRIREQNEALKRDKEHLADSLANIAHQLRTPLTSLNLIVSLLANNPEEEERRAFIRESEVLLLRMDWLITSLLKLSRLDAGIVVFQREEIAVDHLVHTAVRPFLISMELRNIDLKLDCPDGVTIQGDEVWLSEAVQNILKNCLESAGENGRLEIHCKDNLLYTGIVIRDSGKGFDPEEIPHLFDRYYRGKNPGAAGYGIGLALSRMIITRQGGSITAQNHPQGGAIFTLRFPK